MFPLKYLFSSPPSSADNLRPQHACAAGSNVAENLIAYHVYSFSSFLFYSLIASAIKISKDVTGHGVGASLVDVNLMGLRVGMLVSSFDSVFGCGFLMMTLSCGSHYSFAPIGPW